MYVLETEVIKPKIKHSMDAVAFAKNHCRIATATATVATQPYYINSRTSNTHSESIPRSTGINVQKTRIRCFHGCMQFLIKTNHYFIGNEQKDTIHYK